jgi:hypothetical protein
MGKYEINLKSEVQGILKLYAMDEEVRNFIDELYFANYVEYQGKLRLAIRRNIDKINEFIEGRDS